MELTEEQKKIQSEIEAKMKAQMDGIVHAPYAFTIGEHVSPIRTCDGDLDVIITKNGENYAIMKIVLTSLFGYIWDTTVYHELVDEARKAGFAYSVVYRLRDEEDEILIQDLRVTKQQSKLYVPAKTIEDMAYLLFEDVGTPRQMDWRIRMGRFIKWAENKHFSSFTIHALERLQASRVTFDTTTNSCYATEEKDEHGFFKALLSTYDKDYICRYTTYEALERILRDKKQSVCSIVCMNDKSECYYADAYLAKRNKAKFGKKVEVDYKKVNKCMISSCTHIRLADKLSLWRMYADDGKGVCLKFKINKNLLKEKGFHLFCVDYAYDEKGKHWILDLLAHIRKMKIIDYTFDFEEWHIWRHFFKPSHYDDEYEVRLLYFNEDTDRFKWIKTGDSQILAPVVEFEITENNNEFPLELSEIILGPKFPEVETNAEQIRYFKELQKIKENGDCPVTLSKIKGYR